MTNKIEISRELLSHAAALLSSVHSDVAHQLTALLAAPVVERQEPVAWMALNRDGFPEKCLPSDPEGFPVYRSAPARRAGDPVGFRYRTTNGPWEPMDESPYADGRIRHCCKSEQLEPLYAEQPAPVAVDKYDDVLLPFLALMRAELHANAHKGDRPGWLQMDSKTAILEVFYHMGKLHQAVHRGEESAIKEYAADVANMCMMLLDVCACLDKVKELNQ